MTKKHLEYYASYSNRITKRKPHSVFAFVYDLVCTCHGDYYGHHRKDQGQDQEMMKHLQMIFLMFRQPFSQRTANDKSD